MPDNRTWIGNCVLCGVEVKQLLDEGNVPEARRKLQELSSELDTKFVTYLLHRIEEGN